MSFEDDQFFLKTENVPLFLEEILKGPNCSPILKDAPVEDILKYFNNKNIRKVANITYSPEENGYYITPRNARIFIDYVVDAELSKGVFELLEEGVIDILWDEDKKDFMIKKTL